MKKRRRRKPKLGVRKAGANSRGQEDARRAKQRAEKESKVARAAEELINPFDHMNMDQKKEAALSLCKRRLQVIILIFFENELKHFDCRSPSLLDRACLGARR